MNVFHGTWIPSADQDFENGGQFVFWVETPTLKKRDTGVHPAHVDDFAALQLMLNAELGFSPALISSLAPKARVFHAALPSTDHHPLPSVEMAQLTGEIFLEAPHWTVWSMTGLSTHQPLPFLREIQVAMDFNRSNIVPGGDLIFWMRYGHHLRTLLRRHQFLPVLKCRALKKRASSSVQVYTGWAPAAALYEQGLKGFAAAMPDICRVGSIGAGEIGTDDVNGLDAIGLLRHFSEEQTDRIVQDTPTPKRLQKLLGDSWVAASLTSSPEDPQGLSLEDCRQWASWHGEILGLSTDESLSETEFTIGMRLHQPNEKDPENWCLDFFVAATHDPSLRLDLSDWWELSRKERTHWLKQFGEQFERRLLVSLGQAARICPLLWEGMETATPTGLNIGIQTAYEFLKEDVAVLESAGFRIVVPAWWTQEGRRRARIRVTASGRRGAEQQDGGGFLDLPSLVKYRYDLCIGGEAVTEAEWQALIDARRPLVEFRGEWVELDPDQMSETLALWQRKQSETDDTNVRDMLKDAAEVDDQVTEFVFDEVLDAMLAGLQQARDVPALPSPTGLQGTLRPYQMQGVSWLASQEALGLNPCLADDMGLGKTLQVIALLLHEREQRSKGNKEKTRTVLPTLLIAPTSVLSNWQREIEKFAPQLVSFIHHGGERETEEDAFVDACVGCDIVITSFTLARKDRQLLMCMLWKRIVVDEAQNIKNPRSAQARAICALDAPHRIALTGTPVENRLMDLWSLFHFLNPGYLGTAAQFRRAYETPIQRYADPTMRDQLKRLVQPFILRRLKTDRTIIADLPDKMEQKVYCNLTVEQAALYAAVVRDVEEQLEEAEGIQRKGLMLSTLMKLKQICNHPSQFLQDGSAFTEHRSHKLTRINEMIEEALAQGDSLLVFTQFTEVGDRLEGLLRQKHACPVHYLHGGVARARRDKMIESFQDSDSPPSVFILSLRAGGVGITLTRANHVFHFDRWWNPAVENQATDRAYRIGQQKTVFAHKFVVLGTLEERIDNMIEEKKALAESVVGSDEAWLTEMDNAAFKKLIKLNRSAILEEG